MEKLTPKQKARYLYEHYYLSEYYGYVISKEGAIRLSQYLVDNILKEPAIELAIYRSEYWKQVKLELGNIEI